MTSSGRSAPKKDSSGEGLGHSLRQCFRLPLRRPSFQRTCHIPARRGKTDGINENRIPGIPDNPDSLHSFESGDTVKDILFTIPGSLDDHHRCRRAGELLGKQPDYPFFKGTDEIRHNEHEKSPMYHGRPEINRLPPGSRRSRHVPESCPATVPGCGTRDLPMAVQAE